MTEKDEWRKKAGECVYCKHYNYECAQFESECFSCKRFCSDLFEPNEAMTLDDLRHRRELYDPTRTV